ncbi:Fc.00g011400.m01.CDS01 [Cosmosporella sp. VM-42]
MGTPDTLRLEIATLHDVPAMTEIWFAAFTDPGTQHLWPDTPGVRKWWDDANRSDLLNKPFQRYVKIVDPKLRDSQGRLRIAAYAKWDFAMPEERGRRYPPWHEDMPGEDCDAFFQKLENGRQRVMGERKHYYLDTLATHPEYQRRGAGTMLLKWGCDVADENGVGTYVDASKAGAPLYQKFGFVDESESDTGYEEDEDIKEIMVQNALDLKISFTFIGRLADMYSEISVKYLLPEMKTVQMLEFSDHSRTPAQMDWKRRELETFKKESIENVRRLIIEHQDQLSTDIVQLIK